MNLFGNMVVKLLKRHLSGSFGLMCFLLLFITIYVWSSPIVIAQTHSNQGIIEDVIAEIVEDMPRRGTMSYVQPTASELGNFKVAIESLLNDNLAQASEQFETFGYTLTIFQDTGSVPSETLYVIQEDKPVTKGWGTYIFRADSSKKVHVQVPHPLFDTNTPTVGIRAFNELKASYFSMAGTHRYANGEPETTPDSDMARNSGSIFHLFHTLWSDAEVIQIHGFNDANPSYVNYPETILSNGTTSPQPLLYIMQNRFIDRQITAGVFDNQTSNQLSLLGATRNVQGQWSANNSHTFVHVELARHLRLASYQIGHVVQALNDTFNAIGDEADENEIPDSVILHQNYPNPFNQGTIISYSIDLPGVATLQIFDMSGRLIQQRNQVHSTAGVKSFQFMPTGVASGSYVYTLLFSNGYSTVKLQKNMILLK